MDSFCMNTVTPETGSFVALLVIYPEITTLPGLFLSAGFPTSTDIFPSIRWFSADPE